MAKKKKEDNSNTLFWAGTLLGIGIGLLSGKVAAFTIIGMALGFLMKHYSNS